MEQNNSDNEVVLDWTILIVKQNCDEKVCRKDRVA